MPDPYFVACEQGLQLTLVPNEARDEVPKPSAAGGGYSEAVGGSKQGGMRLQQANRLCFER